ncbi:LAFA_0F11716g1_1 [Lachancea sp. 'fantastica']|nr:LAFA_0F11716g1_1 [Lachancea sp. 'fantastica']
MPNFNHSIIQQFQYLNNSQNALIVSNRLWASAVNYPYQVVQSFYRAILLQYETQFVADVASNGLNLGATAFVETAGYFFSNYAVGCFVTALVLNRIVSMASLRSPAAVVRLPLWPRVLFHGTAIAALLYNLSITIRPAADQNASSYFAVTYAIICASHCIETFITTTSNAKPMEEFDYSIFELSMHFYSLARSGAARRDYVPDCLMALLGRLIIHSVEITRKRKYRLLCSTIINMCHMGYLGWTVLHQGTPSLPLLVKYRHIPKTMALACIVISLACYALACFVRLSPFGSGGTSGLRFHSFMNNWYSTLNCTGEEEFTSTLINFAVFICNPAQTDQAGLHRELSQLTHQNEINRSFLVSGYMNKQQTGMMEPEAGWGTVQPVWRRKWDAMWRLENALKNRIKTFLITPISQKPEPSESRIKGKNLNDYLSDTNYQQFFAKAPDVNATGKGVRSTDSKYLLPEDDWSADYIEDCSASDGEASEESESGDENLDLLGGDDDQTQSSGRHIGSELTDLLLPVVAAPTDTEDQDPQWLISMWSILQYETRCDRRLTRSQYARLNESRVLQEIMAERTFDARKRDDPVNSADRDLSCVVCKTNVRNIVLWPCKCFALCEECRVSLGVRGFNTCICCRVPVNGYSRINAV